MEQGGWRQHPSPPPPPPQGRRPHHIFLLPFLAQGHIFPFISLADLLHQRYNKQRMLAITLVTTAQNAISIRSSLPQNTPINVVSLPFNPVEHGLPPQCENTNSLPYPLISLLFRATHSLLPHLDLLVSQTLRLPHHPHVSIIADIFCSWSITVAKNHGAFHAIFTTCGAFGTAAYTSLWLHTPHKGKQDDEDFTTPGFPETFKLRRNQLSPPLLSVETSDEWSSAITPNIEHAFTSTAWLCNSAEELEPKGMRLLRRLTGATVWPVGPVFLAADDASRLGGKNLVRIEECVKWLNTHKSCGVLYVSFGSQNTLGASQMLGLARAMEASGHTFLWVVRPPIGYDFNGEFKDEWLPPGFEARVTESGKGMLVRSWAPQVEILSHPAVGGFLSHCGWNSTLESLSRGVPLLGWPMAAEQFYNSKMMEEEMGVCVEVARGVVEEVEWQKLEKLLRDVMGGEKGEDMRRRAKMVAEKMKVAVEDVKADEKGGKDGRAKGSSLKALDEFMDVVWSHQM